LLQMFEFGSHQGVCAMADAAAAAKALAETPRADFGVYPAPGSKPLKFSVARLPGNEMHLLRPHPSIEPRVEQAVCRGQHLTRPNQCAGAVTAMTKPMNDIHAANRYPRPSVRRYGFPMINRAKYASRVGCRSRLLSLSANEKERDSCYSGSAQNGTSGFIPKHS
jgi:hypothetical protein